MLVFVVGFFDLLTDSDPPSGIPLRGFFMPVTKFSKHTSWDAVSRDSVNDITDANALALWVYLITKPEDWIPRESQIREHFGWGHDRYRKAMTYLKENGYAERVVIRSEKGRITSKHLHIYAVSNRWSNQPQAEPTASLPDSLHKRDSLQKKKDIQKTDTQAREIIDHLNAKAGRSYKPVNGNLKLINARLAEGFTVEELKGVIDTKCKAWLTDPKMAQYLRPSTLFNSEKCAQYAGEAKPATPKKPKKTYALPTGEPLDYWEYKAFVDNGEIPDRLAHLRNFYAGGNL